MAAIFRFLVLGGIAFVGISYVIYQLLNFKFSLFGSKRQLERDIESLRSRLLENSTQLVALDKEEIPLVSGDLKSNLNYARSNGVSYGLINSIYQEPLGKFAIKNYKTADRGVSIINFNQAEFTYVKSASKVKVYRNGKSIAYISKDNQLWYNDEKKPAASLRSYTNEMDEIFVADQKVGNMYVNGFESSGNQRAFSLVNLKDEANESSFLILTLHELVRKLGDTV